MLFILAAVACGRPAPSVPRVDPMPDPMPDPVLAALKIQLGERAFNEPENDGFVEGAPLTWTADPLLLTQAGMLSGHFELAYTGEPVANATSVEDVLFWQVAGSWVWDSFGDFETRAWSELSGTRSSRSSPDGASFDVGGAFTVPPKSEWKAEGMTLSRVELHLTWVRRWVTPAGARFQVLAGGPDPSKLASAQFDVETTGQSGRFGWYAPRPVGWSSTGEDFDYVGWFATH
jgi:hypothetical protein